LTALGTAIAVERQGGPAVVRHLFRDAEPGVVPVLV
jgi:hypothetical protein